MTLDVEEGVLIVEYKFAAQNSTNVNDSRPSVYSNHFPGGERRLTQKPVGLHYLFLVNGVVQFEDEKRMNTLPGKLLRSLQVAA